ncbi:hypothetical protein LXT21_33225 [Myxococcus sp. K38C18041901]|uniref:hypothetical protein n=1 Tax=Myxococcus guangdongensis TaxID=2906760 RepID=UPI0020A754E3|nr:hypothetical protein [Myxococcus guangdongensis]MCP3063647.1 hypothetical protein [Myxococcus guangdongensis]
MTQTTAFAVSFLTALSLFGCNSADVADPLGQAESAATSVGVGTRTRYLAPDGACGDQGTNVCSFGFGTTQPTELLTVVGANQVELTYLTKPELLLARGGLAVKTAILLDEQVTNELGLPTGTLVQPQFSPLVYDTSGFVKVRLNIGTVLVEPPDKENFDPQATVRCCSDGHAKTCRGCVGGNSSERPPFSGSSCCMNSIHFDPSTTK